MCPACGHEYTGFEYFKMNIMSKLIFLLILAFLSYNIAVIISFNHQVRTYMDPDAKEPITYDELNEKYEKLNPVQQYLSRYSDIENGIIDKVANSHVNPNGDSEVTIFTQNGSYAGLYAGELTGSNSPNGAGNVVFTNKDGVKCTYEGEFSDGVLSGYGILSFATGETMKGSFQNGLLNGYGEMYYANGKIQARGSFINNKLNGNGILFDKNGNVIFNGVLNYGIPQKNDYTPICENVEYNVLKSNPKSLVGKNICISGVLSDVHIDENSKQFYLFTPNNDPTASFLVYCEDSATTFNLTENYTIYGYCQDYGTITNSHSIKNNGVKLNGYHFEN